MPKHNTTTPVPIKNNVTNALGPNASIDDIYESLMSSDEELQKQKAKSILKLAQKKQKKERDRELKQRCKEQQEMEIEALQAIFQDDFLTMDPIRFAHIPNPENARFRITLKPYTGGSDTTECFVSVYLVVGFPEKYPTVPPNINVMVNRGLPQKKATEIEEQLQQAVQSRLGTQMVFDLCEIVKDFLNDNNDKPMGMSFHQQMLEQQQKDENLKKLTMESKNQQQQEPKEWESTLEDNQLKDERKNFRLQKSLQRAQWERERKKQMVEQYTNAGGNAGGTNEQSSKLPGKTIDKQQTLILHLLRQLCQNDSNISPDQIKTLGSQLVQLGILNPSHLTLLNSKNINSNQVYQQIFHEYFSKPLGELSNLPSKNSSTKQSNNDNQFVNKFWGDLNLNSNTQQQVNSPTNDKKSNTLSPSNQRQQQPQQQQQQHQQASRYSSDFEEIQLLGRGGFGQVVKVRNKLDGRYYAIKKIKLDSDQSLNKRILREVITLSRLHHSHVVRYYQAWIEGAEGLYLSNDSTKDELSDSESDYSSSEFSDEDSSASSDSDSETGDDENSDEYDESFSDDILFQHNNKRSLELDLTNDSFSFLHSDSGFLYDMIEVFDRGGTTNGTSSGRRFGLQQNTSSGSSIALQQKPQQQPAKKNQQQQKQQQQKQMALKKNVQKKKLVEKKKSTAYLYIQMEYCQKILRNLTESGMNLEDDDIWKLFRQIVEGMAYVHSQGIIHRDLKPSNIFFDSCGDIKIGDFGLAITNSSKKSLALTTSADSSATTISTSSLVINIRLDPEQEAGTSADGGYDDKVDMYSLGIVFFEMWYVFSTGHERVCLLRDLRENLRFPPEFERTHSRQAKLIRWLIEKDPAKRPSAQELLQSELMPPKMEDEHVKNSIRIITNPTNQFYQSMLNSLFSPLHQHLHSHIYHQHPNMKHQPTALSNLESFDLKEEINDSLVSIFRKHNANHLPTPLMSIIENWDDNQQSNTTSSISATPTKPSPTTKIIQEKKTAKSIIMDDSGQLFELRFDLRTTFSHYLSVEIPSLKNNDYFVYKSNPLTMDSSEKENTIEEILELFTTMPFKRYEIGQVYRKPHLVGKLPKELFQCCFDIVGSRSLMTDAEVVKVACEIFDVLPSFTSNYFIRLNHQGIVEYMWKSVGIQDPAQKSEIGLILSQLIRQPWVNIKKILLEKLNLPVKQVERLANWVLVKGSISDVLKKLENSTQNNPLLTSSMTNVRISASFTDFLDEIKQLNFHFEKMAIPSSRIVFDLGYVFCESFYTDGTMFQVILKDEVNKLECIAVGGRYDAKICNHPSTTMRNSSESSNNNQSPIVPIVGLSIALDKIYQREKEYSYVQKMSLPPSSLLQNQQGSLSHKFSAPDIFICSIGPNLFMERVSIVSDLWNAGFRAETMYSENPPPEEQMEIASTSGAVYVVIIKEKGSKKMIKVKNIEKKKEDDVTRDELVKFFTSIFTSRPRSSSTPAIPLKVFSK
eukprot:gene10766-13183_t